VNSKHRAFLISGIMGDLNASMWSPAYKRMMRRQGLKDAREGHGLVLTQHGHGPVSGLLWRPIDHCLHNDRLAVRNFYAGPDLGSDHLPIVAELCLNPAPEKNP
jgi:endonuclease/exonuclease/phosphatase (EEP) superfamily protein YafD